MKKNMMNLYFPGKLFILGVIFFIITAMLISGCSQGSGDTAGSSYNNSSQASGYRITGLVGNPKWNQFISGAVCSLEPYSTSSASVAPIASVSSDQNGSFLFNNVPKGRYKLVISKEGYITVNTIFTLDNDMPIDLYLIKPDEWNSHFGADHAYNTTGRYIVVWVADQNFKKNNNKQKDESPVMYSGVSGISVSLNANAKQKGTQPFTDDGYINDNGVIEWNATSTYNTGRAVFYGVEEAPTYTIVAQKDRVTYSSTNDITATPGAITSCIIQGKDDSEVNVIIKNNSGTYADKDTYITITGQDKDGYFYYFNWTTRVMTPIDDASETDYYTKLSNLSGSEGSRSFIMPTGSGHNISGRLWLSVGEAVTFSGTGKALTMPSPVTETTLFDKIEFTFNDDKNECCINTTCADYVGLCLRMAVTTTGGDTKEVGFNITSLSEVFNLFINDGTWKSLVVYSDDAKTKPIRVLNPCIYLGSKFAPDLPADDPNRDPLWKHFDGAIKKGWDHYQAKSLNTKYDANAPVPQFTFKGKVDPWRIFNIKCTDKNIKNPDGTLTEFIVALPTPSTKVVFECAGEPLTNDGNDTQKSCKANIGAAINRGVLTGEWNKIETYYKTAPYNGYSKILHDKAINGLVYGFPYDDHYGTDSTITRSYSVIDNITVTIPSLTDLPK